MLEIYPEIAKIAVTHTAEDTNKLLEEGWFLMGWELYQSKLIFVLGIDTMLNETTSDQFTHGVRLLSERID